MEVINFSEIRDELISNMRRQMLIPVIGAGFTKGCKAFNGVVPDAQMYRQHMMEKVIHSLSLSDDEINELKEYPFPQMAEIYHKYVPIPEQKKYLRNNFTNISLEEYKHHFLSLPWPYIYTLNIDDGIETSNDYDVVYSNRPVDRSFFDDRNCLIKLHGDVSEMLKYEDSQSGVITQRQYIESFKKNTSLLDKLKHDSIYQNLIFIGCSLDNEIDLLFSSETNKTDENVIAKYICVVGKPNILKRSKYQQYGMTHCIVFDTYKDIYESLYSAGIEAGKIALDDLDNYKKFSIKKLSPNYEDNKPYLLFGKSMIDKGHIITMPYFFITRQETETVLENMKDYPLQFLIGGGCSGKTYTLVDIACRIKNRDVFFFETKDRLSDIAYEELFSKENCIILADATAFSHFQIESLLRNISDLKRNKISVIIAANKNDRELQGIIKLCSLENVIELNDIPQIEVKSKFSKEEIDQLNPLLTTIGVGLFNKNKTIIDNIIETSKTLNENNRYKKVLPYFNSTSDIASLIALATERKLFSKRAVELHINDALDMQWKRTEPLIDRESTWTFEKSITDNSPCKYVINAEYWLYEQLKDFVKNEGNYMTIATAYKYIIAKIIEQENITLDYNNKMSSYKNYILFDNINRIFSGNYFSGEKGLKLIRTIYEQLNELLSVDPNYMHQRAKCYIKSSYYEKDLNEKLKYLDKAFRYANVSSQTFSYRFDEYKNDKLLISLDHVIYTQALILCHKCKIKKYNNIEENTATVTLLHRALKSPYNSYDFVKADSFNYGNAVSTIINTTIADKTLVKPEAHSILEELFEIVLGSDNK